MAENSNILTNKPFILLEKNTDNTFTLNCIVFFASGYSDAKLSFDHEYAKSKVTLVRLDVLLNKSGEKSNSRIKHKFLTLLITEEKKSNSEKIKVWTKIQYIGDGAEQGGTAILHYDEVEE